MGNGVFSEENTALVLNLLYLKGHKYRKAFGGESAERIDFSGADRQRCVQAVELLERFESYSSRVQGELNLTSGQETFTAIRQQIMQNLDGTVTGLSCWAADLEDLQETPAQRETQPEASEQTKADSISLSM